MGRAADNGRSRPHHDGNRNPQGKPQGVRRYDCKLFLSCRDIWTIFPIRRNHRKTEQRNIVWKKITFVTDDGGKEEFYVEEQTRINGVNYILVSDSKDDEANAYILKDISTDTDAEAEYVMVEDDTEFDAVSGVFASMLDDEADITY